MTNVHVKLESRLLLSFLAFAFCFAAFQLSKAVNGFLTDLPVSVPTKLSKTGKPTPSSQSTALYPVIVAADPSASSAPAPASSPAHVDRLFALDVATIRAQATRSVSATQPVPDPIKESPKHAGDAAEVFRVDGLGTGGAFISGRFFPVGARLEGIQLPVSVPPGDIAVLKSVEPASLTIEIGKRVFVVKPYRG